MYGNKCSLVRLLELMQNVAVDEPVLNSFSYCRRSASKRVRLMACHGAYWHGFCIEISILKCISKLGHVQIEIIAQVICKNGLLVMKQVSSHSPMRYHDNLLRYYCNWDSNYTTNTVNDPIKPFIYTEVYGDILSNCYFKGGNKEYLSIF